MDTVKIVRMPFILVVFLTLALFGFAPPADAAAPEVGRINQVQANAFILGKDDVDWSYVEPNLIVEKEDVLQTDETGRVEIEFPNAVLFRIGESSRAAVLEIDGEIAVGMDSGRGYLRIGQELSGRDRFVLTFPTGEAVTRGPALMRIDLREDGSTDIRVSRGTIEVESISEGAREVSARQQAIVSATGEIESRNYAYAAVDEFDRWNEERDIARSTYRRPEYIEEDIVGAEDLDGYGEWVYADTYNTYVWQPHVVEVWRPYYYGHWYSSPYYGWTWIPEEPWGYVTYHYGSWNYDPHYRWVWVPDYVWRPAHVQWIEYDTYVGWVPLNYYGYPVITSYPYHVVSAYSSIDFFSFTFVHVDFFHHRDHHYYYHHHYYNHHDHDRDHDYDHGRDDRKYDERHRKDYDRLNEDYRKFEERRGRGKDSGREINHVAARPGERVPSAKPEGPEARLVKNINNERLVKAQRKGRIGATDADYADYLDTKRNPAITKKIDKINRTPAIRQRTASPRFPEKPAADRTGRLDSRRTLQQRRSDQLQNRVKTRQQETPAPPVVAPAPGNQQPNRQTPELNQQTENKTPEINRQPDQRKYEPFDQSGGRNDQSRKRVTQPALTRNNAEAASEQPVKNERIDRLRRLSSRRLSSEKAKELQAASPQSRTNTARLEQRDQRVDKPAGTNRIVENAVRRDNASADRIVAQNSDRRQERKDVGPAQNQRVMKREARQAHLDELGSAQFAPPAVRTDRKQQVREGVSAPPPAAVRRQAEPSRQAVQQAYAKPAPEARFERRSQPNPQAHAAPQPQPNYSQPQQRPQPVAPQAYRQAPYGRESMAAPNQSVAPRQRDVQSNQMFRGFSKGRGGR